LPDAGSPIRITTSMVSDVPADWLAALEARHLANLRIPEVTRALRALSSAYVERRQALARGAALDSAGKRAAFALFYAPLHYLVVRHIVMALGPGAPDTIVDLGCGTGAAGAAWSLACDRPPRLVGIDRHPWAVEETRWTYRQLRLDGHAKQSDAARFRPPRGNAGVIAAYLLNELPDETRITLLDTLLDAARRGTSVLIVEPIARGVTPWWTSVRVRIEEAGGSADEWDVAIDRPPLVALLDEAAGLDHRRVKARSLFIARNR
jgi:Methyltransferase domain